MLALAGAPPEVQADGHGSAAIDDILTIMQDANMVDDEGAERIRAKYAIEKQAEEDGLPTLYLSGDLRTRFEHFDVRDNFGPDGFSRSRGRYRIRLNGKAVVNEYVSINFRITSGGAGFEDNIRSTNTTFDGRFNRDDILWDRAYADIKAPWFQTENGGITLEIGKVLNPFINKVGKDFMVWDGDVNPEGVSALAHYSPFEGTNLYLNGGFYIVEENNDEKDPKLTAVQAGFTSEVIPNLELGLRGSGFFYASVDAPAVPRCSASSQTTAISLLPTPIAFRS